MTEIREGERKHAWGGFWALFFIMAAHGLLETARDALFLTHLSAELLPWVYMLVALVALATTLPVRQGRHGPDRRSSLVALQLGTAGVTCVFWVLAVLADRFAPNAGTYALSVELYVSLYVWSGVAGTLVVMRLWLLLGGFFSTSQAKRLYAFIATGGVLGITAGFGFAGLLTTVVPAPTLVFASACVSGLGALVPWLMFPARGGDHVEGSAGGPHAPAVRAEARPSLAPSDKPTSLLTGGRTALRHPYVRRVTAMVVLSAMTVTVVDYVFKSVLARSVEPVQLGTVLASTYFALNLSSLVMLLFLVTPFLRRFGVAWALPVLPVMVALAGAGVIMGGGIVAAMALKGADGTLRHSLHKTAVELLYLPMSARLRESVRTFIDVLGQRGGQALASVVILLLLGLEHGDLLLAGLAIAISGFWVIGTVDTKKHYLDAFRSTLSEGEINTRIAFPELDMASLETLIAALGGPNDAEVVGAMDILASKGRGQLIPTLILYHPASPVVRHALDLFARDGRNDFIPIADRLLEHKDPEVRAAAVRARAAVLPDRQWLEAACKRQCPAVQVTVTAVLAAHGWMEPQQARQTLTEAARGRHLEPRLALARAAQLFKSPAFDTALRELAKASESSVRAEAIRAMDRAGATEFLPDLVALLAERSVREAARKTLLTGGELALAHLDRCLSNPSLPVHVRRHIPRTISRFPAQAAVEILVRHLPTAAGGMVRYKILRGLDGLLADNPHVKTDRSVLRRVEEHTLRQTYQLLAWRVALERGIHEGDVPSTAGGQLLIRLLRSKEHYALGRLFRLLGLQHPRREFGRIYRGLQSNRPEIRGSSRELLENLLPPRNRDAVLALLDDVNDEQRLKKGEAYFPNQNDGYRQVVGHLVNTESQNLRTLSMYHAAELGLPGIGDELAASPPPQAAYLSGIREQAKSILRHAKDVSGDGESRGD